MAIEIRYSGHIFKGKGDEMLLLSPTSPPDVYEVWDPISETLAWDTLTFGVTSHSLGPIGLFTSLLEWYTTVDDELYTIDDGTLMDYERGTPVRVYKDGSFWREYYLDSIQQRRGGIFEFSCISAVGLLAERYHKGGVYFGETVGDIVAELLAGIDYTIDNDVADQILYGWLPYATARDNLSKILFSTGASLMKTKQGAPWIKFNQPSTASDATKRTYYDMSVEPVERFGEIQLVEHTFYDSAGQAEEVLFDNTNDVYANNSLIVFNEPIASIRPSGLTVNPGEWGANWAIVSGTGILYGTPYVHIQRVLTASTGLTSGEVKEISDNALVSRLNSGNVLDRLVNYYANAQIYSISIKQNSERAGNLVAFPALDGSTERGYIKESDAHISSFIRADMQVVKGWQPTGLGNNYSEYFLITADSSGTITIPPEHVGKRSLIVMFGGAQGGTGGYDGEAGGESDWNKPDAPNYYNTAIGGEGGLGGEGAEGGGSGRYLQFEVGALAATYTGHIGAGGAGGAHNGELGRLGEDTVLDEWSTIDGFVPEGPYINMIDGTIYGEQGDPGHAGKAGGRGGDMRRPSGAMDYDDGAKGENYNTIWRGGAGGSKIYNYTYTGPAYSSGSGGGGAAYGSSGSAATLSSNERWTNAGAGANATAPAQAGFYRGGNGGNGGGGGGGGGYEVYFQSSLVTWHFCEGGAGGLGSVGGQGADGFILFYV